MKVLAVLAGYGIFGLCGYLYGFHEGKNLPFVNKQAIEEAVFMAMLEK